MRKAWIQQIVAGAITGAYWANRRLPLRVNGHMRIGRMQWTAVVDIWLYVGCFEFDIRGGARAFVYAFDVSNNGLNSKDFL